MSEMTPLKFIENIEKKIHTTVLLDVSLMIDQRSIFAQNLMVGI